MPMPTPITVHSRCPWYIDNAHRLIILCPKCPPHSQVAGALLDATFCSGQPWREVEATSTLICWLQL